jgi:hypothetical protein
MTDIILPVFCEVLVRREWTRISLEDALRLDKDWLKRCPACHGRVRTHATGSNGAAAHFEHDKANAGCMWSAVPASICSGIAAAFNGRCNAGHEHELRNLI